MDLCILMNYVNTFFIILLVITICLNYLTIKKNLYQCIFIKFTFCQHQYQLTITKMKLFSYLFIFSRKPS